MLVFRMAFRELWRMKARLGLLALILAMQLMAVGGAYVMTHSFTVMRDKYYRTLHFADLTVGFVAAADTEMPPMERLRAIPGVAGVSRRYVTRGTVEDSDGSTPPWPVTTIYLDPGHQDVNDIEVLRGKPLDPANPSGALIDATFAEERHVALGAPVVVNPYRFATRFTVSGVGMSPEYLTPAVDPRFLLPAKGSMGVIYAPRSKLDELFVDRLYNELLFRYEPGVDEKAAREAIVKALGTLEIEEIVPRRSNIGYRMHEELLRVPRVLAPILAFVIGSLGAIVAYVLMMRIVESQRREIGALLAVGFPAWHFIAAYALVGLTPALFGALVGLRLARWFGRFQAVDQARTLGMTMPEIVMPWPTLLVLAAFAVMVTLIGVTVPLTKILRMSPALAMRGGNEISFQGLPKPLEALVARGRATTRYAIRNVLRRWRLTAAAVLLLGAGIAAPTSLLSLNSSWEDWSNGMAARIRWDATVNFRVPLAKKNLVSLLATPGLHATETFVLGRATLAREGVETHEVRVRGLGVPSALDPRELTAGRDLSANDALEVILNEGIARDERPIRVGEKVALTSPRGLRLELEVVGLVHDAAATTVHVPILTAQRLFALGDKVTGMYVVYGAMNERVAPPPVVPDAGARPADAEVIDFGGDPAAALVANAHEPTARTPETALQREEMVLGLQSRAAAIATTKRLVHEERVTVVPFLAVGLCFAMAAVLSLFAILFLERDGEYATIRSMGYGRGSVFRIVFIELAVLSFLGFVAALVGWLGLEAYIVHAMSKTLFPLPVAYRLRDLLNVAIPTINTLGVAGVFAVSEIQQIELRAALTARGIG